MNRSHVTESHCIPQPLALDPLVIDPDAENARLRAAGPIVEVELPGGVRAWAVTRETEAKQLLTDHRLVRDINAWGDWQRGEIPQDWPLIGIANFGRCMMTVDGDDHRRLRSVVSQALSARRVEAMRPRIVEVTETLLDALPGNGDPVDLKTSFAYPVSMKLISDLTGITQADHPRMLVMFDKFLSTQTPPDEVIPNLAEMSAEAAAMVTERRAHPADDLTGALITASQGGEFLTDEEITNTLLLLIAAGYDSTVSLILNAVVNLSVHPEQRALAQSGVVGWEAVVEETLRHSAPNPNVLIRFATEDVPIGGKVIARGEALVVSYGAIGRDEYQHGPTADDFDITRTPNRHISFGHGPHVCVGSALARLEVGVAIPALYERFPGLTLAVPADRLRYRPMLTQRDLYELPVLLGAPVNSR
ncbi:cytochrome P450 [Streptomyces avermitilis]|uniref:cytochrome P450 family protein n=1 Tax=Streptomyces avermitilis TaxID=33903 RepID=UPI0033B7A840